MAELVIATKNKREEKIVQAFLDTLKINYYTELQEEKSLYKAMQEGSKTMLLSLKQKEAFIKSLKEAR